MDRNRDENVGNAAVFKVALLAEGVDRNSKSSTKSIMHCTVALLAEGVDRNSINALPIRAYVKSPSSRRAWIEIQIVDGCCGG